MAILKPITRVEQYLAHISGMRVNVPEVPLTREEMYLAAWARKSGIEDTEMQGEPPLTLKDCIGEPFNGLALYGKSTQVTTTGAQLFEPISNKLSSNGITITFDENGEKIVVSGTPERSQKIQISKPIQMQAGEKYVLTFDEVHYFENVWLQSSNGASFGWLGKNTKNWVIITVPDSIAERTDCVMYASTLGGEAYNFTINHLMLNTGSTALPWEPYTGGKPSPSPDYPQEIQSAGDDGNLSVIVKNPDNEQMQSVLFSTPNGLPGIPVSANGNYTDSNGQQWVCDEVDLERGVKVQRVGVYKFYSSDGFVMEQVALGLVRFHNIIGDTLSANTGTLTSSALCSALPLGARGSTYDRINVFTIVGTWLYINIENITSVNELQQYLQQTPMTLIALLATPIETPLSETDIAAYRALTTYKGTTILESECYLKVKYSKLRK